MSVVKKAAVRWTQPTRDAIAQEAFKILYDWNELPLNPHSKLASAWRQAQKNILPADQHRDAPSPKETTELKHVIAGLFAAKCKKLMDDSRAAKEAEEAALANQSQTTFQVSSLLDKIKRH